MAIQSTPHTESQQNKDRVDTDLEPNQIAERLERDGADGLYANMEGAQTGTNRSEHVTEVKGPRHNVIPGSSAETGALASQVGHGDTQGVSNHSQQAERDGQQKVMRAREIEVERSSEEVLAGEPVRDSVKESGDLPGKKGEAAETVEVSAMRAVR